MLKVFSYYYPVHTLRKALLDALLLWALILLAGVLFSGNRDIVSLQQGAVALLFSILITSINSIMGLYRTHYDDNCGAVAFTCQVILPSVLSFIVAGVLSFVLPWSSPFSVAAPFVLVLMVFVRSKYRGRTLFPSRILIIGTGAEAQAVFQALSSPMGGHVDIVGFFPQGEDEKREVVHEKILGQSSDLEQVVRDYRIDEVIVAVRERRGGRLPLQPLLACRLAGVRVTEASTLFERVRGQVRLDSLRISWLIYGDGFRQGFRRELTKRCFDLLIALILIVLALPVMLLTALLIVLEDGMPVFYRQERVGLGGRTFKVIKFRSMRTDAEKDGKPRWATSNDDRATRIGRFIRKLRIDELPQLFNVLMGDMSMVGPRPERPFFVDQLGSEIPFYSARHCVKPGVTGWAQVRYQYGASVDDAIQKLQYDLYYIKNDGLLLDALVLLETIRVVLTGEGAH